MGGSPRERFVGELLDGRLRSATQVVEAGAAVGFRLDERCVVAVLSPRTARDTSSMREVAKRLVERFDGCAAPMRRDPRVHTPLLLRKPAILTIATLKEVATVVPAHALIYLDAADLADIPTTYTSLAGELDLARASGLRLVQPADLASERVLREAGLGTALDFVRAVLGEVFADRNVQALLYTLEQVLAWNGPLKKLDAIPYSTVRQHIDRIEQLTGLRLTRPRDRVLLDTALRLFRLNEEALPEVGKKWRALAG